MQYGDEQNLDFDIKVLSRQEHPHIYSLADDWVMELDQEWVTDASGHIYYEPLPELERIAAAVSDDSRHEEIYQNAGIWEVSLESIAVALSGLPLFPEDAPALESLRPQYYQLLFRDPIVAAVAYNALVETINERMERRG